VSHPREGVAGRHPGGGDGWSLVLPESRGPSAGPPDPA
jgi:hypothetical protein